MLINILQVKEKLDVRQNTLSKITGISRNIINMIVNGKREPYFNISDDRYYALHTEYPDVFILPDDFMYYSKLTLLLNKYLYNISTVQCRQVISSSLFYYKNKIFFMYQQKNNFMRLFPELYIAAYEDNDKLVILDSANFLDPISDIIVPTQISLSSWEDCEKEGIKYEEFLKYSVQNFNINLMCRQMKQPDFADILGITHSSLYGMLQKYPDRSFVQYKETMERIFVPYIIPVKLSDLQKIINRKTSR